MVPGRHRRHHHPRRHQRGCHLRRHGPALRPSHRGRLHAPRTEKHQQTPVDRHPALRGHRRTARLQPCRALRLPGDLAVLLLGQPAARRLHAVGRHRLSAPRQRQALLLDGPHPGALQFLQSRAFSILSDKRAYHFCMQTYMDKYIVI